MPLGERKSLIVGILLLFIRISVAALEWHICRASPTIGQQDESVGVLGIAQLDAGNALFLVGIGACIEQVEPFRFSQCAVGSAVADILSPVGKVAGVVGIVFRNADAPLSAPRATAPPE